MQEFDVRRQIEAGPEVVWALLDDSASYPTWSSIDSHDEVETRNAEGLGEVRVFRTGRYAMRERIVERRPPTRLSYTLLSGLAVRDYRAEIDLDSGSAQRTDIRWHTTFRAIIPGMGWVYRRALRKATEGIVDGLAQRAEHDAKNVDGPQ